MWLLLFVIGGKNEQIFRITISFCPLSTIIFFCLFFLSIFRSFARSFVLSFFLFYPFLYFLLSFIHVRAYDLANEYPPPNALQVIRSWSSLPHPKVASHTQSILTLPPRPTKVIRSVSDHPLPRYQFSLEKWQILPLKFNMTEWILRKMGASRQYSQQLIQNHTNCKI